MLSLILVAVPALDLHDLKPDLLAIDRIGDARVAEIESRLGEHLALPDELSISLTHSHGTRIAQDNSLGHGYVSTEIVRGEPRKQLFAAAIYLDGERVQIGSLRIATVEAGPFFRGMVAELATIKSRADERVQLHMISPSNWSVRYNFALGDREANNILRVEGKRPGTEGRAIKPALAAALELVDALNVPSPHYLHLRSTSVDEDRYVLDFPYRSEDESIKHFSVAVWRDGVDSASWLVTESSRQLVDRAVPLDAFLSLRKQALALADGRSLGVFAVARDEKGGGSHALVVTVAKGSIWEAQEAELTVLRVSGSAKPIVAERTTLGEIGGRRGIGPEFKATSAEGHAFTFALVQITDIDEVEPRELVRYRDFAAPLLGGTGSSGVPRR